MAVRACCTCVVSVSTLFCQKVTSGLLTVPCRCPARICLPVLILARVEAAWVAGPVCSCSFATCLDSFAFTWTISFLMSLAKMRSVSGVATTIEITAASASRGSAISSSRFQSRV